MFRFLSALCALLFSASALAIPVTNEFYGSVSRLIVNDCSAVAADAGCAGNQPPSVVLTRQNQSVIQGDNIGNSYDTSLGTVSGDVTFDGDFDAPVVRAYAESKNTDTYVQSFIGAYQTYTYLGDTEETVDIGGTLTFDFSGTSLPSNPSGSVDSLPGEGLLFLSVLITDLSGADYQLIPVSVGSGEFLSVVPGSTTLGSASYLSAGEDAPAPGEFASIDVFSSVTVQPGQSFLISVFLQVVGDRGGYTDANSTFLTGFANASDSFTSQLISGTQVSVPEPSTLGLLMMGLMGLMVSRRRCVSQS